ncbi:MAG: hypothetical protein HRU38_20750 [Saccharospirillaceae bacterium]|nr:HNH/ENDO VII family nuclease [Pseudomonadales bacterium]NRB81062.1 hypothetical protein [Saccharospirillaceae bacterium]
MFQEAKELKGWKQYYKQVDGKVQYENRGGFKMPILDTDNYVRGHVKVFENWRMNKMADEIGLNQSQMDTFMRENTKTFYKVESKVDNASHKFEDHKSLLEGINRKDIIDLMTEFKNR